MHLYPHWQNVNVHLNWENPQTFHSTFQNGTHHHGDSSEAPIFSGDSGNGDATYVKPRVIKERHPRLPLAIEAPNQVDESLHPSGTIPATPKLVAQALEDKANLNLEKCYKKKKTHQVRQLHNLQ